MGTPLIMNYTRCASVQVYDALKEVGSNPFPFALVLVMLVASVLLYSLTKLIFGRKAYAMQGKAATTFTTRSVGGWRALPVVAPFLLVVEVELFDNLAHVLAEAVDVVAKVGSDVGRVVEKPFEVVLRGIVESEA